MGAGLRRHFCDGWFGRSGRVPMGGGGFGSSDMGGEMSGGVMGSAGMKGGHMGGGGGRMHHSSFGPSFAGGTVMISIGAEMVVIWLSTSPTIV